MVQPLLPILKDIIIHDGPLSVEQYMGLCLSHYYGSRDPLGAQGDFITAPEISQIFGELIGAWFIQNWITLGSPGQINWVELGPGRGTLTLDALRILRHAKPLFEGLSIHLVETSPVLKEKQKQTLKDYSVEWHGSLETLPHAPTFFVANEFFDALPIRQYVKTTNAWHKRMVGLREDQLVFGLSPKPEPTIALDATLETILEQAIISQSYIQQIASHLNKARGVALIIDYGYWGPKLGDTLQAVHRHKFIPALEQAGEADLTTHVDFHALAVAAWKAGLNVHGLSTQRDFLKNLGIDIRTHQLAKNADAQTALSLHAASERLTATGATEMGDLFKVLSLSSPTIESVPALEYVEKPTEDF